MKVFGSIISFIASQFVMLLWTFVMPLAKAVGEALLTLINLALYEVLVLVWQLLDVLQNVVSVFSGMSTVSFYGEDMNLVDMVFFHSGLSVAFWGVTVAAVLLAFGFTIWAAGKSSVTGEPVSKVLGRAGKTGLSILLVPFLTIVGLQFTGLVMQVTARDLIRQEETAMVSGMLLATTTIGAENEKTFTEGVRERFISGELSYADRDTVFRYFEVDSMNMPLGLILTLFFILLYVIVCLTFMVRCFQLLLLYLVSPYYAAFIPLDGGQKFGAWRDAFIAKLLSGFGLVVSIELFGIIILPVLSSGTVQFSGSSVVVDYLCRMVFLAGSAFALMKSHAILIEIINPRMAAEENMVANAVMGTLKLAAMMAIGGGLAGAAGKSTAGAAANTMRQHMLSQASQRGQE